MVTGGHSIARRQKAQWLILAWDAYLAKHGVDLVPIVYAEHMSDEGSGPEDDLDEAKDAWKTDMARKAGLAADADLDKLGDIYHKLYELWRSSLMAQQKKRFHSIRICNTERESPRIPKDTPYDFGINMECFDVNKDAPGLRDLLTDWRAYGDPEGFGSKKLHEADGEHGNTGNEGSPLAGPSNI
ncbi:hypothetical protein PAXRUDRAFT_28617 [Paxillus rubicundulus Ve08.2h10]|uniref:Uncharacterized protein n=1 Tax=Paxillus rubicundulus Ve08.2h10 TaxID=930991 RepID=A0A0D0DCT0_9AGAM|nr:hypothetical protein PAXRUDRAFT_28617 [Paxillus rubicundulus Ve08.2h10]